MIWQIIGFVSAGGALLIVILALVLLRKVKGIANLSTVDLHRTLRDPNATMFYGQVLDALKDRGEDVTAGLPSVSRMLIHDSDVVRRIGFGVMKAYFPSVFRDVHYDPQTPSDEAVAYFTALAKNI